MDDYNTDDLIVVEGFAAVDASTAKSFGSTVAARLSEQSLALFGFGTPLQASAD